MDQKRERSIMFRKKATSFKRKLDCLEIELFPQDPPLFSHLTISRPGFEMQRFTVSPDVVDHLSDSFEVPDDQFKAKLQELNLSDLLAGLKSLAQSCNSKSETNQANSVR